MSCAKICLMRGAEFLKRTLLVGGLLAGGVWVGGVGQVSAQGGEHILSIVNGLVQGRCVDGRTTVVAGLAYGRRMEVMTGVFSQAAGELGGFVTAGEVITDTGTIGSVRVKILGATKDLVYGEFSQVCSDQALQP